MAILSKRASDKKDDADSVDIQSRLAPFFPRADASPLELSNAAPSDAELHDAGRTIAAAPHADTC